jgi:hypothetical protein
VTLTGWIKSFGRLPQIVEHRIDTGQYYQVTDARYHQFAPCCGCVAVGHFGIQPTTAIGQIVNSYSGLRHQRKDEICHIARA